MAGKKFELTEYTLSIIEEIGGHMPGGFFIYKAREPQEQIGLPYILKQFETRDQFSVSFMRTLESGPRHYRIDSGKVFMPGGRIGVTMSSCCSGWVRAA